MAKECFCGCGRPIPRIPIGLRSMNTRGRLVSDRLAWFEVVVGFDDASDNIENWIEEGYVLLAELRDAMHGNIHPKALESGPSSQWLKYGRWLDECAQAEGLPTLNRWLKQYPGATGAHPSPREGPVKSPLLEASDRLDDHLLDGPFDPYFKLVLLACSTAAYGALERFVADRVDGASTDPDMRELPDADPHQDTLQLIDAFAETAGADRAVRTVTWAILGKVIADEWNDRWQEIVDLVTAAMPLSPAGLAAAAAHIDACRRWNELSAEWQAKQEDDLDDELDPRAGELFTGSFAWLLTSVMQWSPEDDDRTLHTDAVRWGFVLLSAFDDYAERLRELEDQYPDAKPPEPGPNV